MDAEPRDVRLPLMVSRSEAAAIDAWRYANHVPTRAEAIRRLIEFGLASQGGAMTVREEVSGATSDPIQAVFAVNNTSK